MLKHLMKGNEVIAEAAIRCGCKLFFGYPITPSTEIVEYLSAHLPSAGGTVVQAEDETGAINMCYGAAATGARVMTATSSPGFSLKQEGLSYLAANELPVVVVNVCRSGPGLGGLGATQGDYFQCTKGGGHGDYRVPVLAPSTSQELFDLTVEAFDIADEYRTPVILLLEGFLGQMMEPVQLQELSDLKRPEKAWRIDGCRGREKRNLARYTTTNDVAEAANLNYQAKFAHLHNTLQRAEEFYAEDAEYLIVGFGSCGRIAKSAVLKARAQGLKVGLLRPISLWPFPEKAFARLDKLKGILTVELNSGQMIEDVKLAVNCRVPVSLCNRMGGFIPTDNDILRKLCSEFGLDMEVESC